VPSLAFDTSVLSCFARAAQLETLEALTAGHRRVVVEAVLGELRDGIATHPSLAGVEALAWLEHVRVDSLDALRCFSEYVRILGSGPRDIGEAATLAWVEVHGGIVLIDEQVGVNTARARGIQVRRSLGLVADGVRSSVLTREGGAKLVDELQRRGGARFPCTGSDFLG
jgi:predicted nucleic acid-binding protein